MGKVGDGHFWMVRYKRKYGTNWYTVPATHYTMEDAMTQAKIMAGGVKPPYKTQVIQCAVTVSWESGGVDVVQGFDVDGTSL